MRDRFARDNEGKRSCKCDRNGNSAETQPLYRDFNSAVIGTRRAMMGNRLVDSSTGNRDGITTEFSLVAGVIAGLFSMLRNYRWKGWNGWMEVGSWIPGSGRKFVSGNIFIIYERFMDIYLLRYLNER